MSIKFSTEINSYNDLDDILWGGAREKWNDATDDMKETVWCILEDCMQGNFNSLTDINDIIWFDCDDIFYPEDDSDDEELIECIANAYDNL